MGASLRRNPFIGIAAIGLLSMLSISNNTDQGEAISVTQNATKNEFV